MDSVNPQAPSGNFLGHFGVKFYRYRMLAWRYWWVLLLTGGLGLGLEAWSLHRKPRLFDSSSQVYLREELNTASDDRKYSLDKENFVGTALAMLKSPEILVRARQRVALEAPQYATAEPPEINTALVPHAFIWTVSGRGKDPEYTRRLSMPPSASSSSSASRAAPRTSAASAGITRIRSRNCKTT